MTRPAITAIGGLLLACGQADNIAPTLAPQTAEPASIPG